MLREVPMCGKRTRSCWLLGTALISLLATIHQDAYAQRMRFPSRMPERIASTSTRNRLAQYTSMEPEIVNQPIMEGEPMIEGQPMMALPDHSAVMLDSGDYWDPYMADGCADIAPAPAARGGLIGAVEASAFRLHMSGSDDPNTFATIIPPISAPNYDFDIAPRAWAGYQGPGGLGVRARGMYFRTTGNSANVPPATIPTGLLFLASTEANVATEFKMNVYDLEVTQEGRFSNWELQLSGGARYARLDFDRNINATVSNAMFVNPPTLLLGISGTRSSDFWGIGPTIAFSGRRPLFPWDGLAVVSNARFSMLFGDTDRTASGDNVFNLLFLNTSDNDPVTVLELKLGLEYSYMFSTGARAFAAGYFEGQVWDWAAAPGTYGDQFGLWGPSLSLGLER